MNIVPPHTLRGAIRLLVCFVLAAACSANDGGWTANGFEQNFAFPTARNRSGRWWGSFGAAGDVNTGKLQSPPFTAKEVFQIWYAGYPSNPGNRLYLQRVDAPTLELPFAPPNSREEWASFEVAIPKEWVGKQIVLVAIDQRKEQFGWFAVQVEPPGAEAPVEQKAALAALLLMIAALVFVRFAPRLRALAILLWQRGVPALDGVLRRTWPGLLLVLFVARRTSVITAPSLWAEDGALFLPQYFAGFFSSLVTPYAGYLHTAIRLWCIPAALVPFNWIPYYLATAGFMSFAGLVLYSSLRMAWPINALICLAALVAPVTGETFLNLVNSQWMMSLWPGLLLIADPPTTAKARWADRIILVIAGLSGPFSLFWLAPFGLRFLLDHESRARRENFAIVALTASIQLGLIIATNTKASPPPLEILATWPQIAAVLGRRVQLSFLIGHEHSASFAPEVALLIGLLGIAYMCARSLSSGNALLLSCACAFVLFAASGFFRYPASISLNDPKAEILDRYFLAPRALWIWWFLFLWRENGKHAKLGLLIASLGLVTSLGHFFIEDAPPPAVWSDFHDCAVGSEGCTVPIRPTGWFYPVQPGQHRY